MVLGMVYVVLELERLDAPSVRCPCSTWIQKASVDCNGHGRYKVK
jgi:hypothetical protein